MVELTGTPTLRAARRRLDRGESLRLAALGMAATFVLAALWRALGEAGGTNSYALLAEAFLHARLDVERCFDGDCARFADRLWIIFPPVPALVALPFVAAFGPEFAGFIALGVLLAAAAAALWWRIFERLGLLGEARLWAVLAIVFASPLYLVAMRSDGVWFFAQTVAFTLVTLAIHEALSGRRLWLVGFWLGLAVLCRQMSVFYAPFLLALVILRDPRARVLSLDRTRLTGLVAFALPLLACLAVYFLYNVVRFGSPLNTGYGYIAAFNGGGDPTYITRRLVDLGTFSPQYLLFNLVHLLAQGFHLQFGGTYQTELVGMDPNGTSLLAASPYLILLFFVPWRREIVVGAGVALVIGGITLFYHSNGFSQYNTQRYALDWLPIAFYALAFCVTRERLPVFKLLVAWGLALNLAAMAILAITT